MGDQVIDGIISGFAVLILVWVRKILQAKWENRAFSTFWEFMHSKVYIILPAYYSSNGEQIPPNMARFEDVIATELLISMLISRGIKYQLVDHFENIPSDVDVILVCSPKSNKQSALFNDKVNLPYEFRTEGSTPYFVDKDTGVEYKSPSDKNKGNADFALIGRYTNKEASRREFILWGIHGVGTLATVKFAMNRKHVSRINKAIGKDDFAVLIKGNYSSPLVVGECEIVGPVKNIIHR